MRDLEEEVEVMMTSKDVQHEPEAQSNSSSSSLPRSSGLACSKTDDQDSSGLCFNFTHMDGKIIL